MYGTFTYIYHKNQSNVGKFAARQPLTNQGPLILLPGIIQIAASWTAKNTNSAQTDFSQGYDYYKHLPLALQILKGGTTCH